MKKEIQYTSIILITFLLLFTGCSAVPTADRYSQENSNQTTTSENQKPAETSTINSPVFTVDYESIFSGFDASFVKIPDKVQSESKSGLYWYRFPEPGEQENNLTEVNGFTLLVHTSDSAEAADSVELALFEKTGVRDISVDFSSGKYHVFYGSYPDFPSAAEAVIKLNENNFSNCLPVPKKISIRKKF